MFEGKFRSRFLKPSFRIQKGNSKKDLLKSLKNLKSVKLMCREQKRASGL